MSAGQLRHKVRIESQSSVPSDTGDFTGNTTWTLVDEVWASIKHNAGDESSGARDSTKQKANIKIRHRSDITNKMRIVFSGINYDIEGHFDPTGKKAYLMLSTVIANA